MPYNLKYKMEWKGLDQVGSDFYYYINISILEDEEEEYEPIILKASTAPFILKYECPEDDIFYPFRASNARIKFLLRASDVAQPEDFFLDAEDTKLKVEFFEWFSEENSTLKWTGFIISDTVQYEWQDDFYFDLIATDNLATLKNSFYTKDDAFAMYNGANSLDGKSFILFLSNVLKKTGQSLNINVMCNYKHLNEFKTFEELFVSEYVTIDYQTYKPKPLYDVLFCFLRSIGCIIYQSNDTGRWTILNINEINTAATIHQISYDADGVEITDADIDIDGEINTVGSTLKWCDKNQIVSILKSLQLLEYTVPYNEKNLLKNYGFWNDESVIDGWAFFGTAGFTEEEEFNRPFDSQVLERTLEEDRDGPMDTTEYIFQDIDIINTDAQVALSGAIKLECFFRFGNMDPGGDGINLAFRWNNGTDDRWVDQYGVWSTNNDQVRIPIFFDENTQGSIYSKFKLLTFGEIYNGVLNFKLLIRKLRVENVSGNAFCRLDDFKLSIIKNLFLKSYLYSVRKTDYTIINNTKRIKSDMFHSGVSARGEEFLLEDVIMLEGSNMSGSYKFSSFQWQRSWQAFEEEPQYTLINLVLRSQYSFYKTQGKKFTGNVYGKDIGFPRNFVISSDDPDNRHVMLSAEFDYFTNKTFITTHQDHSTAEMEDVTDYFTEIYDGGSGQGSPGSTTSTGYQPPE